MGSLEIHYKYNTIGIKAFPILTTDELIKELNLTFSNCEWIDYHIFQNEINAKNTLYIKDPSKILRFSIK